MRYNFIYMSCRKLCMDLIIATYNYACIFSCAKCVHEMLLLNLPVHGFAFLCICEHTQVCVCACCQIVILATLTVKCLLVHAVFYLLNTKL